MLEDEVGPPHQAAGDVDDIQSIIVLFIPPQRTNKTTNLFAFEDLLEFPFYPLNCDVGHGSPVLPSAVGASPPSDLTNVVGYNEQARGTPCLTGSMHTCPIPMYSHQKPIYEATVMFHSSSVGLTPGIPIRKEPGPGEREGANNDSHECRPLGGSHDSGTPADCFIT
ncbi:hypothetical protein INR49_024395 [Caranx melampygus]|nr:hypothetical protein INR49_024395 [Caranx melampygus]